VGWESWENIWGIWNGVTPRDAEAARRIVTIEREVAPFLASPEWEPFFPVLRFGIFASRWPLGEQTVWTIVNRNEYDVSGPQIELPATRGMKYFDLYHGTELDPERRGERIVLNFDIDAKGYGAVLATKTAPDSASTLHALMLKMRSMTEKPLIGYSNEWAFLPQQLVPIAATKVSATAPENMVKVPAGDFVFRVNGIEIEGGDQPGVDV
jgi:iron(II)-dependent oxidoreductase